jgi:hypothetical protein
MFSPNRFLLVLIICCLSACATTDPRLVSGDELLEQEAQRNDTLATVAEQSGTPQAAEAFRNKAAENRAAKKVQPTIGDSAIGSAFDALLSFFTNSLERRAAR